MTVDTTMCWKCNAVYPFRAAKCHKCGAANGNADISKAQAEAEITPSQTARSEQEPCAWRWKEDSGPWRYGEGAPTHSDAFDIEPMYPHPWAQTDSEKEAAIREERNSLDTDKRVCFYEQEFYPLSNFSAFRLRWAGRSFDTSEHAYHWEKFHGHDKHQERILTAGSAHEAFKYAERYKADRRPDWDAVKVGIMRDILRTKATQHEYVRRKLLQSDERDLVENSWRDDYWGWGPNRDGQNMLGKLWMEIRAELRARATGSGASERDISPSDLLGYALAINGATAKKLDEGSGA